MYDLNYKILDLGRRQAEVNNALLALCMLAHAIPITLIASFLEGVILISVRNRIRGESQTLSSVCTDALKVIRPLFLMNLILEIIGISSVMNGVLHWDILEYPAKVGGYVTSVVAILFLLLPFVIVSSSTPFRLALRTHVTFLGRNYVKYITFVLGGMVFMYAGAILCAMASQYAVILDPLPMAAWKTGLRAFYITLHATFFIAAYLFFLNNDASLSGNLKPQQPNNPENSAGEKV
jgi:hypothetical protein